MLDGGDRHSVLVAYGGAHSGIDHLVPGGCHDGPVSDNIGALEDYSAVRLTGPQRHRNLVAGMKRNAGAIYRGLDGLLINRRDRTRLVSQPYIAFYQPHFYNSPHL